MNLPNRITLIRVCLVPVFVVFMLFTPSVEWFRYVALVIFIVASLTDWFDGYLARKNNLVTNFGKFMDPLADKLLVCSALICFVQIDYLAAWIVIIIVAREFIISGFRLVAAEQKVVLAASPLAKVKTACQMVMIIVLILQLPFLHVVGQILIYLSLILTVASLVEYLVKNWKVMDGSM